MKFPSISLPSLPDALSPLKGLPTLKMGLADLAKARRAWSSMVPDGAAAPAEGAATLEEVSGFGANPGALRMWRFVPKGLPPGAPLVVVLHGCTQTAAGYDRGTGWSTLAARHGFALLYPEQQRANNAHTCFNWFEPGDIRRDAGEVASIRAMVAATVASLGIDASAGVRDRVVRRGRHDGGAARDLPGRVRRRRDRRRAAVRRGAFGAGGVRCHVPGADPPGGRARRAGACGEPGAAAQAGGVDLARRRGCHRGARQRGRTGQAVVRRARADGAGRDGGCGGRCAPPRLARCGGRGRVELFQVPGLAHGTPVQTKEAGDRGVGHAMPYILEAGISATWHTARSWGLLAA